MEKSVIRTENAPAPFQGAPYNQAIRVGDLVFVAGQIGLQPGQTDVEGDVAAQTEQALRNLAAILEAAGSSLDKLAKTSVFLIDMEPRRIRIGLRVSPGAARSGVVGRHGQGWKLRVAAPPEGGRANASVVELLAASLDVRRPDIRIVAGAGSRDKVVEISGLTLEEAERRLELARGAG